MVRHPERRGARRDRDLGHSHTLHANRPGHGRLYLAAIGRLASHFGRALSIRLDHESTAERLFAANSVLDDIPDAILMVDRDLRLHYANSVARAMLQRDEAIRLHNGRLQLHDPRLDAKLALMAAGVCDGELRIPEQDGLIIKLHACASGFGIAGGGCITLRISDPSEEHEPPTPARLRERLGLTRRRSEVIAELAAGATETEAAEKLSLGAPTLHTHLRRVYDRHELRSRGDLFALLARRGFDITRDPRKKSTDVI